MNERRKILLVDDSSTTRMLEQMILRKGDYDVVCAADGAEAVVKAAQVQPDLILMDAMMPKMDGYEAVKRIREHEELRNTPIIMVTTRSEAANVEKGFASGCTDYVTKPIDASELLAKIRNCLVRA